MSDPIPKDGGTEARDSDESLPDRLPPKDLPEELIRRRLARLDTRRALADLCKSVPGLEEVLLPRGIQADALTRKSGAGASLLRGVARRIVQDAAAWSAFQTAVQEQIPPETFGALESFSPEKLEDLSGSHTTEGLLLAALSAEEELNGEVVATLIGAWRDEHQQAEKQASEDAHVRELETELERLKQENEQLSFASRAAKERAAALAEEVEVLTGEREGPHPGRPAERPVHRQGVRGAPGAGRQERGGRAAYLRRQRGPDRPSARVHGQGARGPQRPSRVRLRALRRGLRRFGVLSS